MSTLIIKSKIWNLLPNQSINYKEKNFHKQKLTIDHSALIYRKKDKIVSKTIDESNLTSNSNENTNYMNERKDELITILKQGDNRYVVNCGNWSKDLNKLLDENAAYILYKGLTIENLLKEKQKYYVLNQGDIIKLGKVYLKLLHINMTNADKEDDSYEDEEKNYNLNNNSIKEDPKEEDKEDNEDVEEEIEEVIKNNIEEENDEKKEEDKYFQTFTNSLNIRKNNKQKKNKANQNNNDNRNINYSFSYIPKNFKNIDLYIKQYKKGNKKDRLNKSFNGIISNSITNNLIKEGLSINRSKSPKLKKIKALTLLNKFKSNNITNISKQNQKTKTTVKTKLVKKRKLMPKQNKTNLGDNKKPLINKLKSVQPIGKICRICLSGEDNPISNPLMCPCECKGSMKYIHYQCLKNWLNLKVEAELGHRRNIILDQPTITYSTNDISCELCKAKLPDYIRHNGKIFNVLFYKPKYDQFLVFESIRDDNRRTKFIHIIPMIKKTMIKIGRLNTCDLSLPDLSISRVHCCLYIEGGQIFLENNSKYGTKILIQNNNLVMSSSFPLCIEVQNTYMKLILKKNFSLFGCCGVNTTTITKMLVYQEQNEKGFDIFCSMIIRDDNADEENKEEKKEDNSEQNNEINSLNKINELNRGANNSVINRSNEEMIQKEINERLIMNNDSDTDNKIINKNLEEEISKENYGEVNKNKEIKIINEMKQELINNEANNERGIINLNNNSKDNSREEIFTKIEDEQSSIKHIIIKEEKNKNKGNYINRTYEDQDNFLIFNESDIKSKSNLYHDMNKTIQKFDNTNLKDKILSNIKKGKIKKDTIKNIIDKELSNEKENRKVLIQNLNLEDNNQDKQIELANNETQRDKIKQEDNSKEKLLEDNQINPIDNKLDIQENKIKIQNEEEKFNKIEINEEKKEGESIEEKLNNELNKIKIKEKGIIDLSQKKLLNKKLKEFDRNDNSINMKDTRYDKTISDQKEEHSQNAILSEKKEFKGIKHSSESNIIKEPRNINEENKINQINNKEAKKTKKLQYKSIDLNAINELSYGQIQNTCNINYSPIESYRSIFGLRQLNNNEGSSLLAPKHKNVNFQKLELNSNTDKNNNLNKSNASWNKYTYQYEEDKKNKINS